MNFTETTTASRLIFNGRILRVRLDDVALPDGRPAQREVIEHDGGVCVAALTADNELLFVRQFRYPYRAVMEELPAGKLNPGEDPLGCGKRELFEETGAAAERYESLGTLYPSPGYAAEVIHLYLATGLTFGEARPDEDEFLQAYRVPLDEAVRRVIAGEIPDAKTQLAVLKTARYMGR